jgi:hypothetical protein
MSGTSAYLHTYGDHDDSRNPRSSQDCGSRWCWTGIRKLHSTTACSGGVISHLCSPSSGHAGEREGAGRRSGEAYAQGGGGGQPGDEGLVELVLCSPLLGPPLYIGGRGAPLPPPHGTKGGGQGERRAMAAGVGGAKLTPKTLTLAGLG